MKKLLVSSEDTCVWTLAQILNEEQISGLLWSLMAQGKLKKEYERFFSESEK
jgi:hypothetical protein